MIKLNAFKLLLATTLLATSTVCAVAVVTEEEKAAFAAKHDMVWIDMIKNRSGYDLNLHGIGMAEMTGSSEYRMPEVNCGQGQLAATAGISGAINDFMCDKKKRKEAADGKIVNLGRFEVEHDGKKVEVPFGVTIKNRVLEVVDMGKVNS